MKYGNRVRVSSWVIAVSLWAGTSLAVQEGDLSSKFPIDEDDPIASVPSVEQRNADPLEFGYWLQDMVHRADVPFQEGKWGEAIKYYEALRVALPETAINYSKLCTAYENLGDLANAEASCWTGMRYPGTKVITYYQYLRIAIAMLPETADGDAKKLRLDRISQTLGHLRAAAPQVKDSMVAEEVALRQAGEDVESGKPKDATAVPFEQQVELFACQLGVVLNDATRLDQCIEALKAGGAPPKAVLPFEWARLRVAGAPAEQMNAFLAQAKRGAVPDTILSALRQSAPIDAARQNRTPKYRAPFELASKGVEVTAEVAPAGSDVVNAVSTATASSSTENWVAAFATAIGLGAVAWWLRQRALRRGSSGQPAASTFSV